LEIGNIFKDKAISGKFFLAHCCGLWQFAANYTIPAVVYGG
jgi:hypothetical protein